MGGGGGGGAPGTDAMPQNYRGGYMFVLEFATLAVCCLVLDVDVEPVGFMASALFVELRHISGTSSCCALIQWTLEPLLWVCPYTRTLIESVLARKVKARRHCQHAVVQAFDKTSLEARHIQTDH